MSYAQKSAQARIAVDAVNAKGGRKLGDTQASVLKALISHGNYSAGCGWVWDTHLGTVKVLESLVKRGVVEKTDRLSTGLMGRPYPADHPYHGARTAIYKPAAWIRELLGVNA